MSDRYTSSFGSHRSSFRNVYGRSDRSSGGDYGSSRIRSRDNSNLNQATAGRRSIAADVLANRSSRSQRYAPEFQGYQEPQGFSLLERYASPHLPQPATFGISEIPELRSSYDISDCRSDISSERSYMSPVQFLEGIEAGIVNGIHTPEEGEAAAVTETAEQSQETPLTNGDADPSELNGHASTTDIFSSNDHKPSRMRSILDEDPRLLQAPIIEEHRPLRRSLLDERFGIRSEVSVDDAPKASKYLEIIERIKANHDLGGASSFLTETRAKYRDYLARRSNDIGTGSIAHAQDYGEAGTGQSNGDVSLGEGGVALHHNSDLHLADSLDAAGSSVLSRLSHLEGKSGTDVASVVEMVKEQKMAELRESSGHVDTQAYCQAILSRIRNDIASGSQLSYSSRSSPISSLHDNYSEERVGGSPEERVDGSPEESGSLTPSQFRRSSWSRSDMEQKMAELRESSGHVDTQAYCQAILSRIRNDIASGSQLSYSSRSSPISSLHDNDSEVSSYLSPPIGGSPEERVGGSPEERVGGSPEERVDGSPEERVDGSPEERVDGSPEERVDGSPEERVDGSPEERVDGSPEESGSQSPSQFRRSSWSRIDMVTSPEIPSHRRFSYSTEHDADGAIDFPRLRKSSYTNIYDNKDDLSAEGGNDTSVVDNSGSSDREMLQLSPDSESVPQDFKIGSTSRSRTLGLTRRFEMAANEETAFQSRYTSNRTDWWNSGDESGSKESPTEDEPPSPCDNSAMGSRNSTDSDNSLITPDLSMFDTSCTSEGTVFEDAHDTTHDTIEGDVSGDQNDTLEGDVSGDQKEEAQSGDQSKSEVGNEASDQNEADGTKQGVDDSMSVGELDIEIPDSKSPENPDFNSPDLITADSSTAGSPIDKLMFDYIETENVFEDTEDDRSSITSSNISGSDTPRIRGDPFWGDIPRRRSDPAYGNIRRELRKTTSTTNVNRR